MIVTHLVLNICSLQDDKLIPIKILYINFNHSNSILNKQVQNWVKCQYGYAHVS